MPIINIPLVKDYETRAGAQDRVDSMLQETMEWATKTFSNPNLLLNGNFKNPVNQKKFVMVTGGNDYTIDRWRNSASCVRKTENGLIVEGTSEALNGGIYQQLEDKHIIGKTVTASLKVNGLIYSYTAEFPNVNSIQSRYFVGKLAFRIGVGSNGYPYVSIRVADSSQYLLEWVKLEYGNIATRFIPRPYQEELSACKWYMERVGKNYSTRLTDAAFVPAGALSIKLDLHYMRKRVIPTIILSDLSHYRLLVEYINQGRTSVALTDSRVSLVLIDFTYDETGAAIKINFTKAFNTTDAYVTLQRTDDATAAWIDVDAEIY